MSGDRYRVVLDSDYALSLGRALYCFAICEWNAVYCIQKREPDYVVDNFKPTQPTMAGTIAEKLKSTASKLPDSPQKQEWQEAAALFFDLVKMERNRLVHAKPGTNADGEQRLFYYGFEWTIERIDNVADRFSACGVRLNAIMYAS